MIVRESGESGSAELARRGGRQLRADLGQERGIVRRLERRGDDQCRAARLLQRIFQFARAVGWIDVDEDRADLRGRELGDHTTRRGSAPRSRSGRPWRSRARAGRARSGRRPRATRDRCSADPDGQATSASRSGRAAATRSNTSPDRRADQRLIAGTVNVGKPRIVEFDCHPTSPRATQIPSSRIALGCDHGTEACHGQRNARRRDESPASARRECCAPTLEADRQRGGQIGPAPAHRVLTERRATLPARKVRYPRCR